MKDQDNLIYECLRIRMVEEKIIELYPSDLIQSPVHLSIGQEPVAVGICSNLHSTDWVFINYRGHAMYLAKGAPLPEFFAELMGRVDGLCRGKGGSMHLAAPSCGVMGSSAVVASTISHAVGAALASLIKGEKERVFVADFGDGAMEQGAFYESLNFAALHNVPVLFLCQDNDLAVHSPINERQSFSLPNLVSSFGIPFYDLDDTSDVYRVSEYSSSVIDYVRSSSSPAFLRVKTPRYREHVGPGEDFDAGYRSKEVINSWKAKDPLELNDPDLNHYRVKISEEIDRAIKFALRSPQPTQLDLLEDVL